MRIAFCNLRSATRRRAWARGRAFTLIELLVAVTITLIMLAIINQITYSTTELVSSGAAMSDLIGVSRTIGDQLQRDAAEMMGPKETTPGPGVLVIINRKLGDNNNDGDFADSGDGIRVVGRTGEAVRAFVRSDHLVFLRKASGLEPLCPANTNSFSNGSSGDAARVWYGHALRTKPDGTSDSGAILGDTNNNGLNLLASDWILGRQAMLLATTAPAFNYVDNAYANDATVEKTLDGNPLGAKPNLKLFHGMTDVAVFASYGDFTTALSADYAVEAPKLAFDPAISSSSRRLWVNPVPSGTDFASWKIAQMHGMLASRISDFIVEFAGDYDGTPGLDLVTSSDRSAWNNAGELGDIKWYSDYGWASGMGANPSGTQTPWPGTFKPTSASASIYTDDAQERGGVFIWRHDDTSRWPHLIRVRYRLHDPKGRIGDLSMRDPGDPWNETAKTGDPGSGRWFEVVLSVPRD